MSNNEQRSAPQSSPPAAPDSHAAGRFEIGFGIALLALGVVVWLNYGDNLNAIFDGITQFSSGGLLLMVLVLVGSLIAAVMPLVADSDTPVSAAPSLHGTARQNRALEVLHTEKQRILRAIRDMDFDYDVGKFTDAIYTEQRIHLIRQAVAIMRRISALENEINAQQERIAAALAAFRSER